jgi:hypothetical protein
VWSQKSFYNDSNIRYKIIIKLAPDDKETTQRFAPAYIASQSDKFLVTISINRYFWIICT